MCINVLDCGKRNKSSIKCCALEINENTKWKIVIQKKIYNLNLISSAKSKKQLSRKLTANPSKIAKGKTMSTDYLISMLLIIVYIIIYIQL